jgi:hypothetical protein
LPFVPGFVDNVARRAAKAADVGDAAGDVARRVDVEDMARRVDDIELRSYGGPGGGHHIHSKKGLEGHPHYDLYEALCLQNKTIEAQGWVHADMTTKQRQMFKKLGKGIDAGTARNTMMVHNRIAVESLVAGGVSRPQARRLVARSLWDLRARGVRYPTRVPWRPDLGEVIGTFR